MASRFLSPGVYTREQDFTAFAARVGITRLGLVGKTQRGPAFEPIKVETTDDFLLRFGNTDPSLALPYNAQAFLTQSNELTISRVLGSEGFRNSGAWLVVAGSGSTYAGATLAVIRSKRNQISGEFYYNEESDIQMVQAPSTALGSFVLSGSTGPLTASTKGVMVSLDETKEDYIVKKITQNPQIVEGDYDFYVEKVFPHYLREAFARNEIQDLDPQLYYKTSEAFLDYEDDFKNAITPWVVSRVIGGEVRKLFRVQTISDGDAANEEIKISIQNLDINNFKFDLAVRRFNDTDATATSSTLERFTNLSMNEADVNFIGRAIGTTNEEYPRRSNFITVDISDSYPENSLPAGFEGYDLIDPADPDNLSYSGSVAPYSGLTFQKDPALSGESYDFSVFNNTGLTGSSYVVNVSGSSVDFTYNSLSGAVNTNFYMQALTGDTGFTALNIAVIGTGTTTEFVSGGDVFTLSMQPYTSSTTTLDTAGIYYKTTYLSGDSVFRTYLGISELAYTSLTQTQIAFKNSVQSIEKDLFQYQGGNTSQLKRIKGFHLENTADSDNFVSGDKNSLTAYTNDAGTLLDRSKMKFTLVPYGGFDGFDKYATYSETYEEFTEAYMANFDQYKKGVDVFANREVTDINVFATPGIDYSNNLALVNYSLDMVESRGDSLYVIDAPRLTQGDVKGTPEEAVAILESTGIDSSYACTYWPWIQMEDVNNSKYTWQAPTLLAIEAMAFTDNVSNPWFAPAGMNRGRSQLNIVRADVKMTQGQRDTLYQGRINPVATFSQQGVVLWGQKTLQINQSALDRINVRRLMLEVRRLVAAASLTLVFEQNDQTLRDQFLSRVEPILLNIQNKRGLTAFKVVMDDSNNTPETIDRNTLIGKIQLKPTPTAEFVDLTFQVLPTGAEFSDF